MLYDATVFVGLVNLLWPPNTAGHYILPLWFILSFFFFFLFVFLTYSQQSQTGCLPYFRQSCGLSMNLECRCEMCCTRLAENTGHKNLPSAHHRTTLYLKLNHVSTIGKTISCICPHNVVNIGPLVAEIGWRVWGTPANFNGFRVFASLLHRLRSTEVNQTLHNVWPSSGLVHYTYILGALVP